MTSRSREEAMPGLAAPPHTYRVESWHQKVRGGTIEDRRFREVTVSLPPEIENLDHAVPQALGAQMETALREIATLDETRGGVRPRRSRA